MQLHLKTKLPTADEVTIEGENFPVPPAKKLLGHVCAAWFLIAIGLAALADKLPLPPELRQHLVANRGAILISGFVVNMLGSSLTQTGAFEVFVNGQRVYSKLATGVTPSPDIVGELILNHTLLADYLA